MTERKTVISDEETSENLSSMYIGSITTKALEQVEIEMLVYSRLNVSQAGQHVF